MTSLAFILGVVPLVLATGAGPKCASHSARPSSPGMLGVTIFGSSSRPLSMSSPGCGRVRAEKQSAATPEAADGTS